MEENTQELEQVPVSFESQRAQSDKVAVISSLRPLLKVTRSQRFRRYAPYCVSQSSL